MLCLILVTGCTSTNEDPTNIELEVLRVSLLEKELIIDELHQSLDENNRQNNTLIDTIEELEDDLESVQNINERLLQGQTQILTIQENKPHFYDVVNDVLYILTVYNSEEFDYTYEELLKYVDDEPSESIYQGTEIQYKVDVKTNFISIVDDEYFMVIDNEQEVRFTSEIDLNDPLIELESTLYIENVDKQESYVFLWKYIEEEIPTLYSIIKYDYQNVDNVIETKHNVNTQHYEISDEHGTIVYVEETQEANSLISLNLTSGEKQILLQNETEPFSMYKNDGNIYYFDQENDTFLRYHNN